MIKFCLAKQTNKQNYHKAKNKFKNWKKYLLHISWIKGEYLNQRLTNERKYDRKLDRKMGTKHEQQQLP